MEKIQHNTKLWERKGDTFSIFIYWCPGCGHAHSIPVGKKESPTWNFGEKFSFDCPTFTPSVRHYTTDPETKKESTICHYHVQAGQIAYCGDCQHELSGKTVSMQDIPENYGW